MIRYSHREIRDLFFAGLLISFAFAILFSGGWRGLYAGSFYLTFTISFFTAGVGFLLHELGHKYSANYFGLGAEFKAFYPMIGIAVLLSFFGLIIAAPGAVFISGSVTSDKNGKISLAGPLMNVILGIIFFIPLLVSQMYFVTYSETITFFLMSGLSVNAIFALFNLLPVSPLDGAKVIQWNKGAYFSIGSIALLLFLASMVL